MNRVTNRINGAGFTLIELLVVMSVIALLSSITMVNVNIARAKARDAKRIADINNIAKALIMFKDKYGEYPRLNSTLVGAYPQVDDDTHSGTSHVDQSYDNVFLLSLEPQLPLHTDYLFSDTPMDPINLQNSDETKKFYYIYVDDPDGIRGPNCPKDTAYIFANRLERGDAFHGDKITADICNFSSVKNASNYGFIRMLR